eukprot:CFRG5781T1
MPSTVLKEHQILGAPPSLFCVQEYITQDQEAEFLEQINTTKKWTTLRNRRLQNWGGLPSYKGMVQEKLPKWLTTQCEKLQTEGIFDYGKTPNHVLVNEYFPGQGIMPHEDGPLFSPTVATITLGSHCVLEFYPHRNKSDTTAQFKRTLNIQTIEQQQSSTLTTGYDGNIANKNQGHVMEPSFCVYLPRRSLFVLKDSCYNEFLHGISNTRTDIVSDNVINASIIVPSVDVGDVLERGTRVSMTIRHVPKILKESVQHAIMSRLTKK